MDFAALSPPGLPLTLAAALVSLTLGLASFLAVLLGLSLTSQSAVFRTLYRSWLRIFAVCFALSLAGSALLAILHPGAARVLTQRPPTPEALGTLFLEACLAASILVAAASARLLLKTPDGAEPRMALRMAIGMFAIVAPLRLVFGHTLGEPLTLPGWTGWPVVCLAMIVLGAWGVGIVLRGKAPEGSPLFLRAAVVLAPLGLIAVIAGWR